MVFLNVTKIVEKVDIFRFDRKYRSYSPEISNVDPVNQTT